MTTIQKCAGLSPIGTQACAYREACKRYTIPETPDQKWAAFYAIAGDDCEHFIPMVEATPQPIKFIPSSAQELLKVQVFTHQAVKFRPNSGTEGDIFFANWCHQCARDKGMSEGKDYDECTDDEMCKIIGASMCYDIEDAEYPSEWILKDGVPTCTAFIKVGEPVPFKDEFTIDMFEVKK